MKASVAKDMQEAINVEVKRRMKIEEEHLQQQLEAEFAEKRAIIARQMEEVRFLLSLLSL